MSSSLPTFGSSSLSSSQTLWGQQQQYQQQQQASSITFDTATHSSLSSMSFPQTLHQVLSTEGRVQMVGLDWTSDGLGVRIADALRLQSVVPLLSFCSMMEQYGFRRVVHTTTTTTAAPPSGAANNEISFRHEVSRD